MERERERERVRKRGRERFKRTFRRRSMEENNASLSEKIFFSVPIYDVQASTSRVGQSAPKQSENTAKPFMLRFDPSLVGTPWDDLPNHVEGQDPYWTTSGMRHLFVDPGNVVRSEKILAYWSSKKAVPPTAFFLDEGFLRINPRIPAEYKFVWRPDYDPFKPEKSKSFLKYSTVNCLKTQVF